MASTPDQNFVLIHGIGGRAEMWSPLAAGLEAPVLAVDLPGFNGTELGDTIADVDGYVDAVEQMLVAAGWERPTVVGSSLGGAIALELGRRGAASAVIAFAPIGFWGRIGGWWCRAVIRNVRKLAPVTARAMPVLARFPALRGPTLGIFYGRPRNLSADALVRDFEAFAQANVLLDVNEEMTRWRFDPRGYPDIPVTIAWGSRDLVLPAWSHARRARRRLRRARHVQLAGCGHLPFTDDPESCRQLLMGRFS